MLIFKIAPITNKAQTHVQPEEEIIYLKEQSYLSHIRIVGLSPCDKPAWGVHQFQ